MRSISVTQRRSREVIWDNGRTGGTNSKSHVQMIEINWEYITAKKGSIELVQFVGVDTVYLQRIIEQGLGNRDFSRFPY